MTLSTLYTQIQTYTQTQTYTQAHTHTHTHQTIRLLRTLATDLVMIVIDISETQSHTYDQLSHFDRQHLLWLQFEPHREISVSQL